MNLSLKKMKLQDLERQMREAAQLEDFEAAIEIRAEVKQLRDDLKIDTGFSVIDMFTRNEFDAEAYHAQIEDEEEAESAPATDVLGLLNALVERASSGEIKAIAVITEKTTPSGRKDIGHEFTDGVLDNLKAYVGAAQALQFDLLDIDAAEHVDIVFDDEPFE